MPRDSDRFQNTKWKAPCGAALLEFNRDKLRERPSRAQQALAERLREVSRVPAEHLPELLAMGKAISPLKGLREIFEIETARVRPTTTSNPPKNLETEPNDHQRYSPAGALSKNRRYLGCYRIFRYCLANDRV